MTSAPDELDAEVDNREEPCPECADGELVSVGRPCRETGHQPFACDKNCGYYG